jgi:hypothetical protein
VIDASSTCAHCGKVTATSSVRGVDRTLHVVPACASFDKETKGSGYQRGGRIVLKGPGPLAGRYALYYKWKEN